jgi:hypothetical protein
MSLGLGRLFAMQGYYDGCYGGDCVRGYGGVSSYGGVSDYGSSGYGSPTCSLSGGLCVR